jgi:cell division protein FtsX
MSLLAFQPTFARGGFLGGIVSWFIRVVIYDICVSTIQEVTGVSRMVALFIFLGIMLVIGFIGYMIKQRSGASLDDY